MPTVLVFDNGDLSHPYRKVAELRGGAVVELQKPVPEWLAAAPAVNDDEHLVGEIAHAVNASRRWNARVEALNNAADAIESALARQGAGSGRGHE
jgi:hypothetical protein